MKIEIKERKLTEGKRALYLEYYETGFRKRENLHLYLLPDDAVGAAKHNRLTYNKAMEIRAERILTPPVLEKENAKSEEQGNGLTWLQWCDDYIKWSVDCGNCKKMIGHKNVVRKRIATYLRRVDKKDILLKDVSKDEICGLFDYMRNKYRNKRQIKTNGGRLADYTLLLFEETVKAVYGLGFRENTALTVELAAVEERLDNLQEAYLWAENDEKRRIKKAIEAHQNRVTQINKMMNN